MTPPSVCGQNNQVQVLRGHTDYINSIVYEPEKGELVLSGSDDHTAKLWEDCECVATVNFSSPVMSVAWHQQDIGKVKFCICKLVSHCALSIQGADWTEIRGGFSAQLFFTCSNPLCGLWFLPPPLHLLVSLKLPALGSRCLHGPRPV